MNQTNTATSTTKKLYIAGTGMISPLGNNTAMTAAAVNAGISAYTISEHYFYNGEPLTMASVPDGIFTDMDASIDEGNGYDWRHDRVTKMAIIAIREACAQQVTAQPIPLVMAMSEGLPDSSNLASLMQNLVTNCTPWLSLQLSRSIRTGRAAGMDALDFAFHYLYDSGNDFILVGGSDSYQDDAILAPLDAEGRLLKTGTQDGFAPGEAACFLLLTPHIRLAKVHQGHVIAVHPPGIAEETGHLYSAQPYRGDGLDQAFNRALINQPEQSIHSIYSSMNGENHWAKEYGVAFLRNRNAFKDPVRTTHPADCYGDLGSATATSLIALAAEHLCKSTKANAHLVYSSSDTTKRGAVVVEKIAVASNTAAQSHPFSYS